tara:strand:+ start:607 stop:1323 length:717 start_codon:yes stop_codon:yes gene_type:complete
MGKAKDIIVKPIDSKFANSFIKKHHYSGKVVNNSKLHFGAFLNGRCHGVMSFGSPLDKRKVLPLVEGTGWNEMLELNRMAFDSVLPRNSESRCISIAIKLIKKNAPHIKWILSFADGTQCGDGTIYRASGFLLTNIKKNTSMWENIKTGEQRQDMQFFHTGTLSERYDGKWEKLKGYQLRYIYLIDKSCKITVPILPFSEIDKMGARMYLGISGEKVSRSSSEESRRCNTDPNAPSKS